MPKSTPVLCPHCSSALVTRKGFRQNRYRSVPLYRCTACGKYFSISGIAKVLHPPHIIVKTLSLYNLGYSQQEIVRLLGSRHRHKVSQRTVSSWITRYAHLCPFLRLRGQAHKTYTPDTMIVKKLLRHQQVYAFQLHRAKLDLLEDVLPRLADYGRLCKYLLAVDTEQFPHHLFAGERDAESGEALRSSRTKFDLPPIQQRRKENLANALAAHGLLLAKRSRERHEQVQNFMLINDSSSLACEVPVYLTAEHISYFQGYGFRLPIPREQAPITGHIDILQVRQGQIHILDYKPQAAKTSPLNQLTIYALALASHTRLPLKLFQCAWFDEQDYFEFSPLQAVSGKRSWLRRIVR